MVTAPLTPCTLLLDMHGPREGRGEGFPMPPCVVHEVLDGWYRASITQISTYHSMTEISLNMAKASDKKPGILHTICTGQQCEWASMSLTKCSFLFKAVILLTGNHLCSAMQCINLYWIHSKNQMKIGKHYIQLKKYIDGVLVEIIEANCKCQNCSIHAFAKWDWSPEILYVR